MGRYSSWEVVAEELLYSPLSDNDGSDMAEIIK